MVKPVLIMKDYNIMRKNKSVKDILEARKNKILSLVSHSKYSQSRVANQDEEFIAKRQLEIEWKKKNYFGGADSDDGDGLSYKSAESLEVSEWKDPRIKPL